MMGGRRIIDVQLGQVYLVRMAGQLVPVELVGREASGVWTAVTGEGRELTVVFADLGELVEPVPSVAPPVIPEPVLEPVPDFKSRAAGDGR